MIPKRTFLVVLCCILALLPQACNMPETAATPTAGVLPSPTIMMEEPTTALAQPTVEQPVDSTPTTAVLPTATVAVAETATAITFPTVTFNTNANCRLGPARSYNLQTNFITDRSTTAEGRNPDGSWLWVKAVEGYCWVSIATIKDPISYDFLPVVSFPPLPEAPYQLVTLSRDCEGRNSITIQWSNVSGEDGYRVYRDGITLATLKADASQFTDYPPDAQSYLYEVESFNNYGISVRFSQTLPGCTK